VQRTSSTNRANGLVMPTLLEIQCAVERSLVARENTPAAAHVFAGGLAPEARLNIYRNTFIGTLTTALRRSFPAVHSLVGAPFFESAVCLFIQAQPPRSAYLNEYGEAFPRFLDAFDPAASVPYLADVARLEWAVNRALHAIDVESLDLSRLSDLSTAEQSSVAFVPHPSITLVDARYPVDAIWRAVLDQDDAAMAGIDLQAGPVWLLVERRESGVAVTRSSEPAWKFASALFASRPLQDAIDAASDIEAPILLADHLAAGRIIACNLPIRRAGEEAPEMQP
jgi:hypothetical protein